MLQLLTKCILYLFRELANHFIYFRKNQSRLNYWGSFEIVNCDPVQISYFFSLQAVLGRSGTWQTFLVLHFLRLPSEQAFLFCSMVCYGYLNQAFVKKSQVILNPDCLFIYLGVCSQYCLN